MTSARVHGALTPLPAGVVFDLDGTLVDNLALHAEAFARFAERHGLRAFTADERSRWNGRRNSEIFPLLFGRALQDVEWRGYEAEKEADYRTLSRGRLTPMRGALELLDTLDRLSIPYAVATSAPVENVEHTLREIDLTSRLRIVVRGDEVARGKPYPDVFLEAARRLGVPPTACLAFEDAPAGVSAARAAGMCCVGIAPAGDEAVLTDADAPPLFVVEDFQSFLEDSRGPFASAVRR